MSQRHVSSNKNTTGNNRQRHPNRNSILKPSPSPATRWMTQLHLLNGQPKLEPRSARTTFRSSSLVQDKQENVRSIA
eukprot:555697-Amphidinium_carterae.3